LQNTADGHDCGADDDGLLAAQTLAEVKGPYCAEEGADVVDGCDGGEEATSWAEFESVEVVVGDVDAAEDTLVTEES